MRITTPERGFVDETPLNSATDHTLHSQIGFPRDDPEVLGIWHPDVGIVFFFVFKGGGQMKTSLRKRPKLVRENAFKFVV